MDSDKVFGQASPIDKDSELYKYSDINKVHESIDTQGTKYESTMTQEKGGIPKVESKSSLMTPKEQYEFLARNIGEDNIIQLVDGTYFPNVGKMARNGETVRTIEKFLEDGAESVKEMSGVSIKKEVKMK